MAYSVAIDGPAGAGKSTILQRIILILMMKMRLMLL